MQQIDTAPHLIILVGPMGAGKTTVGRHIAEYLGYGFYDVDAELERTTGVSVNLIFEIEKESGFRSRETEMLKKLLRTHNTVVATGGGIVVMEENRALLKESKGLVIYLDTSVKEQLRRLKRDKKRPLLRGRGRKQRLQDMALVRNPLYEEVMDIKLTSGKHPPNYMARDVLTVINNLDKDEQGQQQMVKPNAN